jgi:hypothetical protein
MARLPVTRLPVLASGRTFAVIDPPQELADIYDRMGAGQPCAGRCRPGLAGGDAAIVARQHAIRQLGATRSACTSPDRILRYSRGGRPRHIEVSG